MLKFKDLGTILRTHIEGFRGKIRSKETHLKFPGCEPGQSQPRERYSSMRLSREATTASEFSR